MSGTCQIVLNLIRMSHWRHMMVDGAKFWINCEQQELLRKASGWQLIQSLAPCTIVCRQFDIQIYKICHLCSLRDSNIFNLVSLSIHVQVIKSVCYLGNFVFPLMEESLSMYIYACDLSPRAVEMVKGQLISEWLFGVFNFPKNQRKNLMNFCPRI